jgi:hypothetical protein
MNPPATDPRETSMQFGRSYEEFEVGAVYQRTGLARQ